MTPKFNLETIKHYSKDRYLYVEDLVYARYRTYEIVSRRKDGTILRITYYILKEGEYAY